jgi:hypothetical protein
MLSSIEEHVLLAGRWAIARLLETSPVEAREDAAKNSVVRAVLGGSRVEDVIVAGMNPQHAIVSGQGATPTDSVGYPWNARYTIASGNLMADFRFNVTAESQGRLQVCRLYEMTDDPGVRDMLSFLIARDTMHQNQWIAAIAELEADGLDMTPVPMSFPQDRENPRWRTSSGTARKAQRAGKVAGPKVRRRTERASSNFLPIRSPWARWWRGSPRAIRFCTARRRCQCRRRRLRPQAIDQGGEPWSSQINLGVSASTISNGLYQLSANMAEPSWRNARKRWKQDQS